MSRLVVSALLTVLVACSGDGITVEISPGDTGATRVELFVVNAPCDDCASGFTPPNVPAKLPGITYLRNNPAPFVADVVEGVSVFELRPDGANHTVDLIVAVGYGPAGDSADAVVGVQVLASSTDTADGYARLQATLTAPVATTVAQAAPDEPGLRVQVWRQAEGEHAGCVALERWQHDGNGNLALVGDREYIVPTDDRDCDNHLPPDECDAYYPNAPDTSVGRVCVTLDETSPDGEACMLGAELGCTNDSGGGRCDPHRGTCFPSRLCKATADQGCDGSTEEDCPRQHIFDGPLVALRCTLPTYTPATNIKSVCGSDTVLRLPPSSGTGTCRGGMLTAANGVYGADQNQILSGNLKISLDTSDCEFTLGVEGVLTDPAMTKLPTFLLRLTLANGATIVVPTEITLGSPSIACGTDALLRCDPVTDASLESCVRQ